MNAIGISGEEFFPIKNFPLGVVPVNHGDHLSKGNNYTFINHYHDFCELVIITSGSGVQDINGHPYPVTIGDIFLLQNKTSHFFRNADQLYFYNIVFRSEVLPLPWKYLRKINGYNMIFHTEPNTRTPGNFQNHLHIQPEQLHQVKQLVNQLAQALEHNNESVEAECIGILTQLIVSISKMYDFDSINDNHKLPNINRIIAKLESDFTTQFTLEDLAKLAFTSPRNFSRQFKKATGVSPITYVLNTRLRHATDLLVQYDLPISEIAIQCGFLDSNYFSKKFTEQYHVSPRKYRTIYSCSPKSHPENLMS
jgi:AraC-like DNA-binding protein